MKRWLVPVLFLSGFFLWGQTYSNAQMLKRLDVPEDVIEKIVEIEEDFAAFKREAQVEQNFYKAQLERMLLKADPDMDEVEEVLRESLEWKLRETLAEIERRNEIRQLVGEDTWAKIVRALAEIRQRNATQ